MPGKGRSLVVHCPILEMGGAEVLIGTTGIVVELGEEKNHNLVVRSSLSIVGEIVTSEQSVPKWGPLFDLTGNYVQVVL